jgi:hypothetical protein
VGRVLSGILILAYVFIILPVGGIMKLLRIDRLGLGFRRDLPSYWQARDGGEYPYEYYEQQL